VTGASTANNVQIQQWPCSTGTNQQFTLHATGAAQYLIEPVHAPGMCIGIPTGTSTIGASVEQNTCGPGWNNVQVAWRDGGVAGAPVLVTLQPMYDGQCFDVNAISTADGAPIDQWTCNGGANQAFYLQPVS
jgi:hypothetical protein